MSIFAYREGGQVVGTDTLFYLDTALKGSPEPFIINRYTHVYLLALSYYIAENPLAGMQVFSAFATGLSALLIYFSARSLSSKSHPANGIIAVGLFLGLPFFVDLLLAPNVDTSAMLMLLSIAAVYVLAARRGFSVSWHLVLLGLLFFIGIKTKETVMVAAVLLPGIGMKSDRIFDRKLFVKNVGYVVAGCVVGIGVFVILNGFILSDPLFGFRLSDIREYFAEWSQLKPNQAGTSDYLNQFLLAAASVPFLFYIASGLTRADDTPLSIGLLWAIPLALIAFLGLALAQTGWGTVSRYFAPGLAVVCVLAGYVADVAFPHESDRKPVAISLALTAVLVLFLTGIGFALSSSYAFPRYYSSVFSPLMVTLLVGLLISSRFLRINLGLPLLICALVLAFYPVRLTLPGAAQISRLERANARFYSLQAFESHIAPADPLDFFVATSVLPLMQIGENRDEISAMVNVSLDMRTDKSEFGIGPVEESLLAMLEEGRYTYVLIESNDWDWMRTAPQDRSEWRDRYSATTEARNMFVLLTLDN